MKVSDHAVIRYMERVKEIDVEGIRAEMAREIGAGDLSDPALVNYIERRIGTVQKVRDEISRTCEAAMKAGAAHLSIGAVTYCIKNGAVATILTNEMRLWRKSKPKKRARR